MLQFSHSKEQKMNRKYYYPNKAGWGCVEDEEGFSFYNKITGEEIPKLFEEGYTPNESGWAIVKLSDGWTFFNVNTWELCEERFLDISSLREDNWADVKIRNHKSVLFNPETKEYKAPNYLAKRPSESE